MALDIVTNIFLSALPVFFLATGVWLMLRVLGEFDLAVDALFTTGAGVAALITLHGGSPWLGLLGAALCGAAGSAIAIGLHLWLRIPVLLATLITLTALYSVNLHVLGGSTVNLIGTPSIFGALVGSNMAEIAILGSLSVVVGSLLFFFLHTRFGLAMRAAGQNTRMSRSFGVNTRWTLLIGAMISEALAACGGALQAQVQGYADVNMGVGSLIIGASAILLGELFFRRGVLGGLLGALIGSVLYETVLVLALRSGMPAQDLKLVTGVILVVAILLSSGVSRLRQAGRRLSRAVVSRPQVPEMVSPAEEGMRDHG